MRREISCAVWTTPRDTVSRRDPTMRGSIPEMLHAPITVREALKIGAPIQNV
ncbi:MAG: hypothetical protein IPM16_00835 [Chloroflexi bacterium]|nr:hypothetical protein [Chloroflexota bacterium]